MRIYFVDKMEKNLNIKKRLEELQIENIEFKRDIDYRIYKTDYVITLDFENQYDSTGACSTAEKDSFSKNYCFSMNQHAYTLIKDQLVKCVGCSYGTSVIVGGIGYGKKWYFNKKYSI